MNQSGRLTFKTLGSLLAMAVLFLVLVSSLYLLATMAVRLDRFGQYYHWLLLFNGLALVSLAIIIGFNALRLLREFRARVAGSRLTLRMVIVCILLTLVPVVLVYSFSVKFLDSNIDSWYDVEIEQALDDALQLSRESLGLQMRTLQRVTIEVSENLIGVSDEEAVLVLNEFGMDAEASEMTLIGPDNRIIASTGATTSISVQPNRPDDDLSTRARRGLTYVGVDPIGDGELYIRVVTPVFSASATRENSVLQALYPVAERSSELAESVQSSYQSYRQLVFLRKPLKTSSILTLSLALLLSAMIGVWFAFYAARRLMVPIHDLVEGTRAVAEGDYSRRVYKRGQDELGYLVQSFNYMTMQLDRSRNQAELSRLKLEEQRTYLEAVLRQISSGVITLDSAHRLSTANQAAEDILASNFTNFKGKSLQQAAQSGGVMGQVAEQLSGAVLSLEPDPQPDPHPDPFVETAIASKQGSLTKQSDAITAPSADKTGHLTGEEGIESSSLKSTWSREIEVHGPRGKLVLFCRGAVLAGAQQQYAGQVIAIDDMTAIISAQRDAAWSEVARRLAHEIKNPLTPIRLSAERLRHKFTPKLSSGDSEVMQRLTSTIENQVDAMKRMVNAFAEYAAAPRLDLAETNINRLLSEVALLYEDENVEITLDLEDPLPMLSLDAPRIRQLVHNLIKNSLEAQDSMQQRSFKLRTRRVRDGLTPQLELLASDEGPGFPADLMDRLFEPYVTSKPRGTGLGLAIVKKIVEEHGGTVMAENRSAAVGTLSQDGNASIGARIRVRLPMLSDSIDLGADAA